MTAPRIERRLAAVLVADVAGYTRLMERDEQGIFERLKALRQRVVEPLIAEHRGRVVKLTGDGLLCEFPSIVDAVACATRIQQDLVTRKDDASEDDRILFRIGVNLGD